MPNLALAALILGALALDGASARSSVHRGQDYLQSLAGDLDDGKRLHAVKFHTHGSKLADHVRSHHRHTRFAARHRQESPEQQTLEEQSAEAAVPPASPVAESNETEPAEQAVAEAPAEAPAEPAVVEAPLDPLEAVELEHQQAEDHLRELIDTRLNSWLEKVKMKDVLATETTDKYEKALNRIKELEGSISSLMRQAREATSSAADAGMGEDTAGSTGPAAHVFEALRQAHNLTSTASALGHELAALKENITGLELAANAAVNASRIARVSAMRSCAKALVAVEDRLTNANKRLGEAEHQAAEQVKLAHHAAVQAEEAEKNGSSDAVVQQRIDTAAAMARAAAALQSLVKGERAHAATVRSIVEHLNSTYTTWKTRLSNPVSLEAGMEISAPAEEAVPAKLALDERILAELDELSAPETALSKIRAAAVLTSGEADQLQEAVAQMAAQEESAEEQEALTGLGSGSKEAEEQEARRKAEEEEKAKEAQREALASIRGPSSPSDVEMAAGEAMAPGTGFGEDGFAGEGLDAGEDASVGEAASRSALAADNALAGAEDEIERAARAVEFPGKITRTHVKVKVDFTGGAERGLVGGGGPPRVSVVKGDGLMPGDADMPPLQPVSLLQASSRRRSTLMSLMQASRVLDSVMEADVQDVPTPSDTVATESTDASSPSSEDSITSEDEAEAEKEMEAEDPLAAVRAAVASEVAAHEAARIAAHHYATLGATVGAQIGAKLAADAARQAAKDAIKSVNFDGANGTAADAAAADAVASAAGAGAANATASAAGMGTLEASPLNIAAAPAQQALAPGAAVPMAVAPGAAVPMAVAPGAAVPMAVAPGAAVPVAQAVGEPVVLPTQVVASAPAVGSDPVITAEAAAALQAQQQAITDQELGLDQGPAPSDMKSEAAAMAMLSADAASEQGLLPPGAAAAAENASALQNETAHHNETAGHNETAHHHECPKPGSDEDLKCIVGATDSGAALAASGVAEEAKKAEEQAKAAEETALQEEAQQQAEHEQAMEQIAQEQEPVAEPAAPVEPVAPVEEEKPLSPLEEAKLEAEKAKEEAHAALEEAHESQSAMNETVAAQEPPQEEAHSAANETVELTPEQQDELNQLKLEKAKADAAKAQAEAATAAADAAAEQAKAESTQQQLDALAQAKAEAERQKEQAEEAKDRAQESAADALNAATASFRETRAHRLRGRATVSAEEIGSTAVSLISDIQHVQDRMRFLRKQMESRRESLHLEQEPSQPPHENTLLEGGFAPAKIVQSLPKHETQPVHPAAPASEPFMRPMIVQHLDSHSSAPHTVTPDVRPIGQRHPTPENVHAATGVHPQSVSTTPHSDGGKTMSIKVDHISTTIIPEEEDPIPPAETGAVKADSMTLRFEPDMIRKPPSSR